MDYKIENETNLSFQQLGESLWPVYWRAYVSRYKNSLPFFVVGNELVRVTEENQKPTTERGWLAFLVRLPFYIHTATKVTLYIDGATRVLKRVSQKKYGTEYKPREFHSVKFSDDDFVLSLHLEIDNSRYRGAIVEKDTVFSLVRSVKNVTK